MRKLLLLFAVAGLFCAACERNIAPNELEITLRGGSRAGIGDKIDGYYRLYWSPTDRVMCNGEISGEAIISSKRTNQATFVFSQDVVGPFSVVYPAVEDAVAKSQDCYPVQFLAEQHYTEGTFDSSAAPMYQYTSKRSMVLNHLTGTLRLAIRGNAILEKIVLTSESKPIAGIFDVNCQTGEVIAQEGRISNQVEVLFDEPLQLKTNAATPIFFTLPAGNLGAIDIKIYATDGSVKKGTIHCDSSKPLRAGIVREIEEFEFNGASA